MMKRAFVAFAIVLESMVAPTAHSCSHSYDPVDFVITGAGERALSMPATDFYTELCEHFQSGGTAAQSQDAWAYTAGLTKSAHKTDLLAIIKLSRLNPESAEAVAKAHERFVADMRRPELANQKLRWIDGKYAYPTLAPEVYVPTRLEDYPPLLSFLPKEFELYLRGAACYHTGQYHEAILYWDTLVALPPELRAYRSTWATFMLGKAWQKLGSSRAIDYFEHTRELAGAGFHDPLGLATSSLGWQALSELRLGHFAPALNHYLELFQTGNRYQQQDAYGSLDLTCSRLFQDPGSISATAADPVAQRIVSLWLLSKGDEESSRQWLDALKNTPPDKPPVDAGRMAWLAYNAGDFSLAGDWAEMAEAQDFAARWVQTKLMMRAGQLEEPTTLLRALCNEPMPPYALEHDDRRMYYGEKDCCRPAGDLAVLLMNQGDLQGAYTAFAAGKYLRDAHSLGNNLLSLEEQQAAVDSLGSVEMGTPDDRRIQMLRYAYGSRLFREERYQHAAPYFPTWDVWYEENGSRGVSVPLETAADRFASAMLLGTSSDRPKLERGENLLRAADVASGCGYELFVGPTGFSLEHYVRAWKDNEVLLPTRLPGLTEDIEARLGRFTRARAKVRPYGEHRYRTADIYWNAAQLLPDNDPRTARALWQGGKHIAAKDPKGADKFYKALVRRCRKLPIGQEADERRWFPPKPKDW